MPFTGLGLTGVQRGLSVVVPILVYYVPIRELIAVVLYVVIFSIAYLYVILIVLWLAFLTDGSF